MQGKRSSPDFPVWPLDMPVMDSRKVAPASNVNMCRFAYARTCFNRALHFGRLYGIQWHLSGSVCLDIRESADTAGPGLGFGHLVILRMSWHTQDDKMPQISRVHVDVRTCAECWDIRNSADVRGRGPPCAVYCRVTYAWACTTVHMPCPAAVISRDDEFPCVPAFDMSRASVSKDG